MSSLMRDDYKYTNIATATTTQIYTGNCRLIRVVLGAVAAGTVTISDSASAGTPLVAVIASTSTPGSYDYGVKLNTGLRVTTAGASDVTIVWTAN